MICIVSPIRPAVGERLNLYLLVLQPIKRKTVKGGNRKGMSHGELTLFFYPCRFNCSVLFGLCKLMSVVRISLSFRAPLGMQRMKTIQRYSPLEKNHLHVWGGTGFCLELLNIDSKIVTVGLASRTEVKVACATQRKIRRMAILLILTLLSRVFWNWSRQEWSMGYKYCKFRTILSPFMWSKSTTNFHRCMNNSLETELV